MLAVAAYCQIGLCVCHHIVQAACLLQDMSAAPFGRLDLLQLRPEGFVEYLQQALGFVLVRELHVARSSAGFNRPMYLFQKLFTG